MLLWCCFVVILVVIAACDGGCDHVVCTLHAVFSQHALHTKCCWQLPDGTIVTQVPRTHIRQRNAGRVTFMEKHCSIMLTTSCSCELERAMIKSSM